MKKHRLIALLLACCLILPLVSCGNSESSADDGNDSPDENGSNGTTISTELPDEIAALSFPESSDNGSKKCFRLFNFYWYEDEAFERTCAGLRKYADLIDEVALYCDQTNAPYMDDKLLDEYCSILTERVKVLKEMGIPSVGYNLMNTTGQGDYAVGTLPQTQMQKAVDYNGWTSGAQLCHRSDEYKEFIAKKYTAFAKTGVDFIYVDDDLRAADGKSVIYACFCDSCIKDFNALNNTNYTRESLVNMLNSSGISQGVRDLRQKWSDFYVNSLAEVLTIIDKAVEAVDPEIEMGLMIVHLQYSTYLLGRWQVLIDALDAERVRPGGGVHDENWPSGFLDKTISSARQLLQAEGTYESIYEFEDWPETHYKSPKAHNLECTAALMAGCTAISFASMSPLGNDDVMRGIRDVNEMWNDIGNTAGEWKNYGGTFLWSEQSSLYANAFTEYVGGSFYTMSDLFTYGSAIAYTPYLENSVFTVISGNVAYTITDEEIQTAFSKGVLLDNAAAAILIQRGYSKLVGSAAKGSNCTWFSGYLYENELGGRVAVLTNLPSSGTITTPEGDERYNALVDWVSNGQNPLTTDTSRIASFLRQPEDRSEFMFMLVNASNDTTDEITVSVLGEYDCDFILYDENGTATTISADKATIENGRTTFTVPGMTCWGFCVVRTA